jgi:hypothetical protein
MTPPSDRNERMPIRHIKTCSNKPCFWGADFFSDVSLSMVILSHELGDQMVGLSAFIAEVYDLCVIITRRKDRVVLWPQLYSLLFSLFPYISSFWMHIVVFAANNGDQVFALTTRQMLTFCHRKPHDALITKCIFVSALPRFLF